MIRTIAEVGINHNGDFATAVRLQEAAAQAGCWAVKYQIRTNLHACVPRHLWETTRRWHGQELSYFDYRRALEFSDRQLAELYFHAKSLGLEWFASPWDMGSVWRLAAIQRDYCKVASATVTNESVLREIDSADFGKIFVSLGMSTESEAINALSYFSGQAVAMACTSVYPCPDRCINLRRILKLADMGGDWEVGYSGHERGILPSLYAAAMGATYIERHLTLDKNQEGSDHAASLDPGEMRELCERLSEIPAILGDGQICPLPEEQPAIERLRGRPEKALTAD